MLTLSLIEPEMNGFGRYHAVTREFFRAKTVYFCQLNVRKRVPFHPGRSGNFHGDQTKPIALPLAHVCGVIKDMPPRVFPILFVCMQYLPIKNLLGTRYVDKPLPNIPYNAIWMRTFIVQSYYACTYTLQHFLDRFST